MSVHVFSGAPAFQLTLDDGYSGEPTSYYVALQEAYVRDRILTQAERLCRPQSRRRAKPGSVSLGVLPSCWSRSYGVDLQRKAYEENVGRSWDDVDPEPSATEYGAPEPGGYSWSKWYGTPEYEAYVVARDAWQDSEGFRAWRAAHTRWSSRREQFSYTGRGRDAKSVLAACVVEGVRPDASLPIAA